MSKPIRVTVWGENVHEKRSEAVAKVYPNGMHSAIKEGLEGAGGFEVKVATLDMAEHGLTDDVLFQTDVLTWWGHMAHDKVDDAVVQKVVRRVWEGMGLIVLHSGHYSKVFKALMGTSCSLCWREADEKERIWVCNPGHPIAEGFGRFFEIPAEEMYGEPFGIPNPDEVVFISHFTGGEVFRSGVTWRRGAGKVFYFRPGHETYPTYYNADVRRVIANAVRWAKPEGGKWIDACPMIPPSEAPDPIPGH